MESDEQEEEEFDAEVDEDVEETEGAEAGIDNRYTENYRHFD